MNAMTRAFLPPSPTQAMVHASGTSRKFYRIFPMGHQSDRHPKPAEGPTLVPMLVWGLALCIVGMAVVVAFV